MGAYIMKSPITRQLLIKEVQEEFNTIYPYLKIDFSRGKGGKRATPGPTQGKTDGENGPQHGQDEEISLAARELLLNNFGLSDEMKVSELEILLQYEFNLPAQVLRKSGNLWLETGMTRHWTLRQQNDHGEGMANITNY